MKYISIDIETCGLDPDKHTLLQFGAIIEDTKNVLPFTEIPKFEVLLQSEIYSGIPYALSLHKELFWQLSLPNKSRKSKVIPIDELSIQFANWLVENNIASNIEKPILITVAGKNFGAFDLQFLLKQNDWLKYIKVAHRILDPAILFWDPLKDQNIPSLEICKSRAEFSDTTVSHTCLEDAFDVIKLLRYKYNKLNNG